MDTKDKKLITCHRMLHPRANVERLYVQRENGGWGLVLLELTNKTTTIDCKKFLNTTTDWMLQLVNIHEKQKKNIQFVKKIINLPVNSTLHRKKKDIKGKAIEPAKNLKKEEKTPGLNQLKTTWEQKTLHEWYSQRNADIDIVKTNRWLKSAGLKMETDGLIIAAQE